MDLAPTASTTAALALGDALAMALLVRKGFREEDFARLHPGGKLGKRLMRVEELMHTGESCRAVAPTTRLRDAIYVMSRKGLGIAASSTAAAGWRASSPTATCGGHGRRAPILLDRRAAEVMTPTGDDRAGRAGVRR